MIFKEVQFKNFRIYHGTNVIYLAPEEEKNINVVSGLNGFGKTTFLMGLVWCLYGRHMDEVDEFYKKEIKEFGGYDRYIINSLNNKAAREGSTKFSVSIIISDVNIPEIPCQEIKITRNFDTVTGNQDEVEVLADGSKNELITNLGTDKLTAEEIFIRDFILPIEIAKFFFFDAEKIISLAEVSSKTQRQALNYAYSEVLGIKKYEDLKAELEQVRIKLRKDAASKSERIELEEIQHRVKNHEIEIEDFHDTISELEKEKDAKEFEAKQIQEKLIREGNQITIEQLEELRSKAKDAESKIKELQGELKNSYDIIPFAIAGEKFLEVLKQLEIESEARKSKLNLEEVQTKTDKIINDLIAMPKPKDVVIDYRVEDYYKGAIRDIIKKHFYPHTTLGDDDVEYLHDYSETEKNEINALANNLKLSFKEAFKRINNEYNYFRNELSTINKQIKSAETKIEDEVTNGLRKNLKKAEDRISEIQAEIDSLNKKIGGYESDIGISNRRIGDITKKINVHKQNAEQDKVTARLIDELEVFIREFKKEKKESLEAQILNGLNQLLHKKSFVHKVDVDIIGDEVDIKLRNKNGEEIKKEGLSNGEKQMYASALLKGLVEESDIEFPVFIDSPMQKFDVNHARNIVRYFYPNISDQVVIFPLVKKEMTEEEYADILPKVSNAYLIANQSNEESKFQEIQPGELFEKFEELNATIEY
ncbi:DNA sulfur modification protein DndD [Echinicola shivajiensis]|uniref:DNA sulfur modification protein DndD n=1 Tax=Echinicola shivajiensis TaxID=1035916 RepID=UPI001BFC782D|nr:DNA sulfur modification protein DndD [Echinicola shivajiensis]